MSHRRRRPPTVFQRPEQGWSSLLLLLGMLALLGISVADGRPLALVEGGASQTGAFTILMLSAGLIGYVLARSSMGVVRAHFLGALVGALLLLLAAGAAAIEAASALPQDWGAVDARISAIWARLEVDVAAYMNGDVRTPTMATFLVLGAICWTTAQFSAFGVFRHGRGGPAVMAIGAVLFLNVALGSVQLDADLLPVLPVLALFTSLAMLLLMRLQLTQQRQQWARRHISDTGEVSQLFLRSGVLFVALTVLSASSLTAWATVDAQDVDLGDLEEPMQEMGTELSRWLGLVGVPPPEAATTTIDDSWAVQSEWDPPDGVAFRARMDEPLRGNYWWGSAHDRFDGQTWHRDKLRSISVEEEEPLPVPSDASAGGPHAARASITVGQAKLAQGMVFRPAEAAVIDRAVVAHVVDEGGGIADIELETTLERGDRVRVDAWVRDYRPDATSLTANQLRAASEDYEPWLERYLQGGDDAGITGTLALEEAGEIEALHDNAYDRALELQQRLQAMRYRVAMSDVCDEGEPIPECVLREERGFCQHYATTMAMVLRAMGIPSRIVTGYLSGRLEDDVWIVDQAAYHNWVEAYFPGHGWVRFDPTPPRRGFGQAATAFPDGDPLSGGPGASPLATPPAQTFAPLETDDPFEEQLFPPETTGGGSDLLAMLLAAAGLAAVLLVTVATLLFVRLRQLPEGDAGLAYRGIVSLATRLGYGPHPSQTEYEYAGTLAETIPQVRDDLYLVTDARVETAYGQRRIEPERRGTLRRAYARIRTALLRLSLHLRH